jgi:hypothetical protein
LLVGGAFAATYVFPQVPRARSVRLRVDDAASVTAVDVTWTPMSGGGSADPVQGGTWRFAMGKAPRVIETPVRLRDGRYALEVVVTKGDAREEIHRTIDLGDSDQITVSLR